MVNQTNQKRQKTQINKITNEKVDIRTDTNEIHKIVREHFKNIFQYVWKVYKNGIKFKHI
jgi:hypothetical protein